MNSERECQLLALIRLHLQIQRKFLIHVYHVLGYLPSSWTSYSYESKMGDDKIIPDAYLETLAFILLGQLLDPRVDRELLTLDQVALFDQRVIYWLFGVPDGDPFSNTKVPYLREIPGVKTEKDHVIDHLLQNKLPVLELERDFLRFWVGLSRTSDKDDCMRLIKWLRAAKKACGLFPFTAMRTVFRNVYASEAAFSLSTAQAMKVFTAYRLQQAAHLCGVKVVLKPMPASRPPIISALFYTPERAKKITDSLCRL